MKKHKQRTLEKIFMTETGAEQPSVSLHSPPCESDCFGDTVTSYSEDSAALMDMCVKSEPGNQHISHPEYCTEEQSFNAKQMGSGLQIKTETELVNIKEHNAGLQLLSATEVLSFPSELLKTTSLLSKQCKSETDEVKLEQHYELQEFSCVKKEINEASHYGIKEEYTDVQMHELSSFLRPLSRLCKVETYEATVDQHSQVEGSLSAERAVSEASDCSIKEEYTDLQVSELNSVPCSLSIRCKSEPDEVRLEQHSQLQESSCTKKDIDEDGHDGMKEDYSDLKMPELSTFHCPLSGQCKEETDAVKVEQHSQLEGSSSTERAVNETVDDLLYKNSVKLESSLIIEGDDIKTTTLEQSVGPVTIGITYKVSTETTHGGITHEAQKLQCFQCRKAFESQSHLKRHLQLHSGDKYCCIQPELSFSQGSLLKQHRLTYSGEKPYKCSECGKSFSHRGHFRQHKCIQSGEKPYKCSQCEKSFTHRYTLKRHQLVHSGEKPYKCNECGKSFSLASVLKNHLRIHSGEKPYECSQCGKSFSQVGNLNIHKRVHSGEKPYQCNECGKSFSLPSVLRNHLHVHSGEKPYKCSQCEKSFVQVGTLNLHKRVHSGEKPHQCHECGKSFSLLSVLKNHLHVHSGEKPYKCSQCEKSFSQAGSLNVHKLVHSGEKPYKCSHCGKSFSRVGTLNLHKRVHSGEKPYKCGECGKSFSRSSHLKQHELVHSGEKPYICTACGRSFSQAGPLKRHQALHFGEKT